MALHAKKTASISEEPHYWASQLHGNVIEVIVGREAKRYNVHKTVAINRCPHFKACLSHPFTEALTSAIRLRYVTPTALELVLQYMYTGTIPKVMKLPGPHSSNDHFFVRAYDLASQWWMEELQNMITDRLRTFYSKHQPSPTVIRMMIEDDVEDNHIRLLIMDHLVEWMKKEPQLTLPSAPTQTHTPSTLPGDDNTTVVKEELPRRDVSNLRSPYYEIFESGGCLAVRLLVAYQVAMNNTAPHITTSTHSKCTYHKHDETPTCRSGVPVTTELLE